MMQSDAERLANADQLISDLNAEIVRLSTEAEHWKKKSDTLAASRHIHAANYNQQMKVVGFLEDKILEYWGHKPK